MTTITSNPAVRQYGAAIRTLLALTVIVGLIYPLVITGVAQVIFPGRADGSIVSHDGKQVGSTLIGQLFTGPKGQPLPQYFQSRPSAAGDGYDPLSSSASNLSATNKELIKTVRERKAQVAAFNGISPSQVPPDAVLASASGLDPHISPAYAEVQVARVARERGLSPDKVRDLVDKYTHARALGFLGQPGVNVLELNMALDSMKG
jgi:K+-transporting ATPase ATPase C chain